MRSELEQERAGAKDLQSKLKVGRQREEELSATNAILAAKSSQLAARASEAASRSGSGDGVDKASSGKEVQYNVFYSIM